MITFIYGLECKISDQNDGTRSQLRPAIDKSRIQRQSTHVEACYLTIEIDFTTKQHSAYFSHSIMDGDKGKKHGSLRVRTIITFNQDSAMTKDNGHIRSVLVYCSTMKTFAAKIFYSISYRRYCTGISYTQCNVDNLHGHLMHIR
jgi:hypothetical protein